MSVVKHPMHITSVYWIVLTKAEWQHQSITAIVNSITSNSNVYTAVDITNTLRHKRLQHKRHNKHLSSLYSTLYHNVKAYYKSTFSGEDLEYYCKEVG